MSVVLIALQPKPVPSFWVSDGIGALRAVNSGQATYSSSCADGGYAIDLADLAKAPSGSMVGFVAPDLPSNGAIKSRYAIAVVRGAAPDVTSVGSPERTCNGSTHQPASAYFATATPAPNSYTGEVYSRQPYLATDEKGLIYWSFEPIPNPLRPGPRIHPIEGGILEPKDRALFVALAIATELLEAGCIIMILTTRRVPFAGRALAALGLVILLVFLIAPTQLRTDSRSDPLAWMHIESLMVWAVALVALAFVGGVGMAIRYVRSNGR